MPDLDNFIRAAKSNGATDSFLVDLLRQKGWPERTIYETLGRLYSESTGQPLPQPPNTMEAAREAFFHLLAFGTLASWVFAIGSIWFTMIDYWLPDPTVAGYRNWALRQVSWQIAAILVSFPVFALATRSILADMSANPEKAASGVRRWLTNIALLVAALVFIGDLVTFVAVFLQGELTTRFVAKSAVILLLSGSVFAYYTRGLGNRETLPAAGWHRRFALIAAALITVTIAVGFWKTGSPAQQRLLSEDRRRLQDLSRISSAITSKWMSKSKEEERRMPQSLAELNTLPGAAQLMLKDPFSGQPYEYRPQQDARYELCAVFRLPSEVPPPGQPATFWDHPAGRHCFALEATNTAYYIDNRY